MRARVPRLLAPAMAGVVCITCGPAEAPSPSGPEPPQAARDDADATDAESPTEPPDASAGPPRAGQELRIPEGTARVGSRPGSPGRRASREAALAPVTVPSFHIDRLPYPNDPQRPPRTGVTRERAGSLCAERGKRLCTELEWERACKADAPRRFPTGERFDAERCRTEPTACASPLGVLALGVQASEWTSSDAAGRLARGTRTAVIRGASADASEAAHRCGARHLADPGEPHDERGFRCCRGPRPDLDYPPLARHRAFRAQEVSTERLRSVLRSIPSLQRFADDFAPHGERAVASALGASPPVDRAPNGWATTAAPVLQWSPVAGERAWVIAGTGAGAGLIAVLLPLADGSFVHGASFVFEGEPRPAAVLHTPDRRRELRWTTCWSCLGQSGFIRYRDDGTFIVLQ